MPVSWQSGQHACAGDFGVLEDFVDDLDAERGALAGAGGADGALNVLGQEVRRFDGEPRATVWVTCRCLDLPHNPLHRGPAWPRNALLRVTG